MKVKCADSNWGLKYTRFPLLDIIRYRGDKLSEVKYKRSVQNNN